jgi:hypothetical protein
MSQNLESMAEGLPYLKGSSKAIFFTDFDGTITLEDCKRFMFWPFSSPLFALALILKNGLLMWYPGNDYLVFA